MTRGHRHPFGYVCLIAAIAAFAIFARYDASQTSDDGFVYYRYVRNVLAGLGPVWNAGEHVEGFGSPLWLALLCVGPKVGIGLIEWSRALGIACAAAALAGVWRLARRLGASVELAGLACAAASVVQGLHYWAPSGLETSLYAALIVWTAAASAGGSRLEWLTSVTLLSLARPEGPAMLVVAIGCLMLAGRRRAFGRLVIAGALVPAVAYGLFRLSYYGVPLPNTYYAKATGPLVQRIGSGLLYASWVGSALLVQFAWEIRSRLSHDASALRSRARIAALVFLGALTAIVVIGGGDWMRNFRLLVPIVLSLVAILAAQVDAADVSLATKVGVGAILLTLCVLRYLPYPSVVVSALRGERLSPLDNIEGTMTDVSADVAEWIKARYPPGTLVAVNHAGALPYHLGYPAIDMTGLVDAHIARNVAGGLHEKFDPAYVLQRSPQLVILNTSTRPGSDGQWYHPGYWIGETALFDNPDFRSTYRPLPVYWTWHTRTLTNYIVVYARVGS